MERLDINKKNYIRKVFSKTFCHVFKTLLKLPKLTLASHWYSRTEERFLFVGFPHSLLE